MDQSISISTADDFYYSNQIWQHSKSYDVAPKATKELDDSYDNFLKSAKRDFLDESFDA